jgi:hypothetical protein
MKLGKEARWGKQEKLELKCIDEEKNDRRTKATQKIDSNTRRRWRRAWWPPSDGQEDHRSG